MNILAEIVEKSRPQLEARKRECPEERLAERIGALPARPRFAAAFRGSGIHIIAELKKASPSKGPIRPDLELLSTARSLERAGAAALSIRTARHYLLGDVADLALVSGGVRLPLLRKDFIYDEYQIREAKAYGASCVLLIAAMLSPARFSELLDFAHSLELDVLGEAHTEAELEVATGADLVGVNARDLRTFETSLDRAAALLRTIPHDRIAVAESAVKTRDDIAMLQAAGARGFLIGETLMRANHPADALKELL